MDDVKRVFHVLVQALADKTPERLRQPLPLTELYETILPYRQFRGDLQFDSIGDYEMALLRFLGGDGGYATVEPEEVREFLAREASAVNPSTGVFRGFDEATLTLNPSAVNTVLHARQAYAPPESDPEPAQVERGEASPPGGWSPREQTEEPAASRSTPEWAPEKDEPCPTEPREELVAGESTEGPDLDEEPMQSPVERRHAGWVEPPAESVLHLPTCSTCDAPLPIWRSVSYCPECGVQVPYVECRRCGERLDEDWRHCVACGEPTDD
jgi:hypothetical protein